MSLTRPVSDSDHSSGPARAPVTLVEYGDYECPHCGTAHPIIQELQRLLGKKLRFTYRNFPLTQIHPHAEHAAETAEAAAQQDAFWEMHDMLFEHQDALDDPDLIGYAAALKLDADRVATELEEGTHAARVQQDFQSGVRSGVNGTPTFFINGVRHDGPWDLESLRDAIELAAGRAR